ncbi:zinc finger BED domain-containing protein RICESLEEPER 2-like [Neltuma alba]|uniref:zinc finger BED domain-containing protein RICESLEEPER 2-like n=1 Tax=Neltuma alba TaxID=207710 RepID=UPI0010A5539D|nr:zinc finger BED domain-containing protein RICESLEEPER 2-like [Prosopis alba]
MASTETLGEIIQKTEVDPQTQIASALVTKEEKDANVTNNVGEGEEEGSRKRHRSSVWEHFERPSLDSKGELRAKCEGFKGLLSELEPRFHIPSQATITRDCLKLYLQEATNLRRCIESIRNAVKYVRSSPARFHKFKQLVEKMKIDSKSLLIMDCPTRWNSTYIMLERAIKFNNVFERMEKEDIDNTTNFLKKKLVGPPDALDWKDAKDFVLFLQEFYDITLQFSGSLYVTSNLCFQQIVDVFIMLNKSANDPSSLVVDMAKSMQSKYNKYWGRLENLNHLLVIAVVLDPRYKMKYLKYAFGDIFCDVAQQEAMAKEVSKVLYCLYDHYSNRLGTSTSQTQSQAQTSDKYAEVDKYLQAKLAEARDPDFDILGWWKVNSFKYKILSLIARDVLAMRVSTVSSKSAFSTGGHIIDEFRSSLSSKMAEALICTQNWLSPSIVKLKGLDTDNFNDTNVIVQEELVALNILDKEEGSKN